MKDFVRLTVRFPHQDSSTVIIPQQQLAKLDDAARSKSWCGLVDVDGDECLINFAHASSISICHFRGKFNNAAEAFWVAHMQDRKADYDAQEFAGVRDFHSFSDMLGTVDSVTLPGEDPIDDEGNKH